MTDPALASDSNIGDMAQKKEPNPGKPPKEWPAVSRQSKALKEIDKAIQSDELKIMGLEDLRKAADDGKQKGIHGFGPMISRKF